MPKKIFYVDGDDALRRTYMRMLTRCRPEDSIVEFTSPVELLTTVLDGRNPDLILTDRDMPEMNGEQMASSLKYAGFRGAIVMITGNPQLVAPPPHIDELVHKPIGLKDLAELLARHLDQG